MRLSSNLLLLHMELNSHGMPLYQKTKYFQRNLFLSTIPQRLEEFTHFSRRTLIFSSSLSLRASSSSSLTLRSATRASTFSFACFVCSSNCACKHSICRESILLSFSSGLWICFFFEPDIVNNSRRKEL